MEVLSGELGNGQRELSEDGERLTELLKAMIRH